MHDQKGFSLIELIVAMLVIGILVGIALPAFNDYRVSAYNSSAISDVRNFYTYQSMFKNEYGIYAPIAASDKDSSGLISVNITLPSGATALFELRNLNANTILIGKTDANNINLIMACMHTGGDKIVAIDTDNASIKQKLSSTALVDADLPDATPADDLTIGWSIMQ